MGESDILLAIQEGRLSSAKIDLERLLKRYPNKSYYWALNCYLLYAQGRIDQSIAQCRELARKTPSDIQALSVLHELHHKLGLFKDANQLYDNAIKKYPSPELIEAYFDKSLENYDISGAQKAALQLHKNYKSTREYAYRAAVTCYVLSTQSSAKEKELYLGLAAGFAEKVLPHSNNQEAFVQAQVLHAQGRYADVVQLVEPLKQRMLDLTLIYLDSLNKAENWETLHKETHNLLFKENFNDFDTWKYFLRASYELKMPQEEVLKLINFDTRNSYFAYIHFALVYGLDITPALEKYIEKYKTKPSCASDLLNFELPKSIIDTIEEEFHALTEKRSLTAHEASILANWTKVLLQLKRLSLSDEKFSKFSNLELYDLQLIKMIESLRINRSVENVVKHIILLEKLAEGDPENYKVRVWLLNLYTAIGASTSATKTYKNLKIKMIQQDTLSHKLSLMPSNGNTNELIQIYRFFMTADAEMSPYLRESFTRGLYTKVEDFFSFGQRLTNSLSRHLLIVNILRFSRMLGNDYYNYFYRKAKDSKALILSDSFVLHDNRDFKSEYNLGVDIDPLEFTQQEARKSTEYVKLNYLKEFLIVERDGDECEKLIKLYNKWTSQPAYSSQQSPFENHLSKLYLNIFKLSKSSQTKDKESVVNYLRKNLDMNKIQSAFLSKAPEISLERSEILMSTLELVKVTQSLIRDSSVLEAAKKLQTGLAAAQKSGAKLSSDIKQIVELDRGFVEDQFESIKDALMLSALKIA